MHVFVHCHFGARHGGEAGIYVSSYAAEPWIPGLVLRTIPE